MNKGLHVASAVNTRNRPWETVPNLQEWGNAGNDGGGGQTERSELID